MRLGGNTTGENLTPSAAAGSPIAPLLDHWGVFFHSNRGTTLTLSQPLHQKRYNQSTAKVFYKAWSWRTPEKSPKKQTNKKKTCVIHKQEVWVWRPQRLRTSSVLRCSESGVVGFGGLGVATTTPLDRLTHTHTQQTSGLRNNRAEAPTEQMQLRHWTGLVSTNRWRGSD